MKRNSIYFFTLFLLYVFAIKAQRVEPEFSVQLGGGYAGFAFQPFSKEVSSVGGGMDIGFGFTGFVSQQIGFQIGAGFGMYNITSRAGSINTIDKGRYEKDIDHIFDLYTTINEYYEKYNTLYFNIPVMLHFQTKWKNSWSLKKSTRIGYYALGGIKTLFLINQKYVAKIDHFINQAYYPEIDNWAGTQEFKGFGRQKGISNENKIDFGVLAMFAFETGMKWRIEKNVFLYIGAYFDCGLHDPINKSRTPIEDYDYLSPSEIKLTLLKFADKANLMGAGIRVRFAFYQQ